MLDLSSSYKKESLEKRLKALNEEFTTANDQLIRTRDDVERMRIQRELDKLEQEIEQTSSELSALAMSTAAKGKPPRKHYVIQVVVIAMTDKEAEELDQEVVFDGSGESSVECEHLQRLKDALREYRIEDFTSCYGSSRDDWKPLIADRKAPIREIMQSVVDKLNKRSKELISLEYLSSEFLSPSAQEHHRAWNTLEDHNGILIIDAISMFHPRLRELCLESQLIGSKKFAVIVLSPLKSNAITVNKLLQDQIYSPHLKRAYYHFENHFHLPYEFSVGDINSLRRWLFSILPTIERQGLDLERRAAFQAEMGIIPQGIEKVALGGH
jgi:hypothetical protein